jgi:lysosomal acid lipase/cholesteryl ester hydrolase
VDADYWDISWQKMSIYDIPAGLSYINKFTGQKISYIGHSQGTTQMWAALSEKKENVKKYLKQFISLAPVVYINHCQSTLVNYLVRNEVDLIMKTLNIHEVLYRNWFSSTIGSKVAILFYFFFFFQIVLAISAIN